MFQDQQRDHVVGPSVQRASVVGQPIVEASDRRLHMHHPQVPEICPLLLQLVFEAVAEVEVLVCVVEGGPQAEEEGARRLHVPPMRSILNLSNAINKI